ncbi:MAG: outer membrane protein assembly factor BamB [Pseudomonadota bacterium]|nr:outer membrane protein assembly factor BamB [Pseudomonadota bacterium]
MRKPCLALFSLLLTSGCSYIPWLSGGEEDPRPPAKLVDFTPQMNVHTLWSREVGEGTDKRRLNLVVATHGGRLFVADAEGHVIALNAGDGRVLWERETKLPFSGGPDVDASRIVLGSSDGDLVALSTTNGAELWRARVDSEILSVPRIAGDTVIVHTLDDSVYAFDGANGEERWKFTYPAPVLTLRGSSTPVIVGDRAIVGISGGRLVNLEVATGLPLWEVTVTPPSGRSELERIADIDADPVVVDGIVYVGTYNGDLAAVDLQSGAVLWRRALSAHSGLAAAGGMLYVTDSDDQVWAAQPNDGTGTWKQEQLRYRRLTAPAVVGDLVVVGDVDGYVHWLSRRDGRLMAREEVADGPITARPLVSDGRLLVYGDDGTVAALSTGAAALAPPERRPSARAEAGRAAAADSPAR